MFSDFVKKISAELNKELPGFSAQKLMAPSGRKPFDSYSTGKVSPKKSAVLVLLYPDLQKYKPKTVLIIRPENEGGNHAGQISFPGGGWDEHDKDMSATAMREAEEEIGIDKNSVSIIGKLTTLYIPVSNYMVHPFVGTIKTVPCFLKNTMEVKEILEAGVDEFLSDRNKGFVERHIKIKNVKMKVPCYNINGKIIWGATAMIISELEGIVKKITE